MRIYKPVQKEGLVNKKVLLMDLKPEILVVFSEDFLKQFEEYSLTRFPKFNIYEDGMLLKALRKYMFEYGEIKCNVFATKTKAGHRKVYYVNPGETHSLRLLFSQKKENMDKFSMSYLERVPTMPVVCTHYMVENKKFQKIGYVEFWINRLSTPKPKVDVPTSISSGSVKIVTKNKKTKK